MSTRDLEAHRALLAQYTEQLETIKTNARQLRDELRDVRGHATSPDRFVRASVDQRGLLQELTIDPRVYRTPDARRLADTVTATVQAAARDALAQIDEITARLTPSLNVSGHIADPDPLKFFGE